MKQVFENEIKILNHGMIRLIDHMGSDLSIARNARVSYDAEWRAGEDSGGDAKLINYLYKNGHNTPFEAATVTIEVKAPIFVFRQWHRHRTQSYNELSARYKELPEEFYIPELDQITILLKNGCPREIARSVLPVGTYSHMFATANLNNWFRFLGERLHPHAQYEIRVYAVALLGILEELYPVAVKAFKSSF